MSRSRSRRRSSLIGSIPLDVAAYLNEKAGWSFHEIGTVAGVTRQAVHIRLARLPEGERQAMAERVSPEDIGDILSRRPPRPTSARDMGEVIIYLFKSGARINQISEILGFSSDFVGRLLRREGYYTKRAVFRPLPEIEERTRRAWEAWRTGTPPEEVAKIMGLSRPLGIEKIFRWYGYSNNDDAQASTRVSESSPDTSSTSSVGSTDGETSDVLRS